MKFEKEHRVLENIDEIRIYDATSEDFYKPTPKEFDIAEVPIQNFIKNLSSEVHTLIPYENGKDFIIQGLGSFILHRYDCTQEDVKGRLFSKISPLFFEILYDYIEDVYSAKSSKKIRFVYYNDNRLVKISIARIVFDMDRIFVITNNVDTRIGKYADKIVNGEKTIMLENFSQTGSYYNINGKYTWSQGIYNIIHRPKEESDDYYNIVFDLVIPEDKYIVDRIFHMTNSETSQYEDVIRIMTEDGALKVIEISVYSYFDESGMIIRQGMINDITNHAHYELDNPLDFLLDGFKNSKKLALLIEPLNVKQYNFSKGFYYLIEKDYEQYHHSRDVLENIVEKNIVDKIIKLADGQLSDINETVTYFVDGNPDNKKIVDLYIERFKFNDEVHSLGFLTDITDEVEKQEKLVESNELQQILIKEIHHRVKNNLQILISFLNLEKRAYKNDPDLIIEHMQTRLTSLALLHEKTHTAQDFKNINLEEYLKDHDIKIKRTMGLPYDIKFETEVDESLNLTIEVITPLLLIIDELTMNSIKHSFTDAGENKRITKKITKLDNDTARLIIRDNGVLIDDSKGISVTFGCEIVKSLTKQLDGKIRLIEYDDGNGYELTFPIYMKHTMD